MLIKGLTVEEIHEALEEASNVYYYGNLCFKKEPVKKGNFFSTTITVKESRGAVTGRIMPGVSVGRATTQGGKLRANRAASWNAHGHFMACVYKINPNARIKAGGLAYGGVYLKSEDDMIRHWPRAYSVLCD